ncbi:hypothetical protein HNO89_001168 [Sporosarcina luteola]|nr:hypothetical protein [Sporosarcina luteola]
MFHGSIKQLFPGQMAEVQIGGNKMLARLEVPMKAGDAYYFQVESVDPELQLKIISGPMQAGESLGKQMAGLMESLDLPKTKEMQSLLAFMLKNKIPISREQLTQAEKLVEAVSDKQQTVALSAVEKLLELKLPINEANFRAVLGVVGKEPMHPLLQALQEALAEDATIAPSTKHSIQTAISAVTKGGQETAAKLLLNEAILKLIDRTVPKEERFQVLQWLKKADLLPTGTSLANFQNVLQNLVANNGNRETPASAVSHTPLVVDGVAAGRPRAELQQPISGSTDKIVMLFQHVLRSSGKDPVAVNNLKSELKLTTWLPSEQKAAIIANLDRLQSTSSGINEVPLQRLTEMVMRSVVEYHAARPLTEAKDPVVSLLMGAKTGQELNLLMTKAEESVHPTVQRLAGDVDAKLAELLNGSMVKETMQTIAKSFGLHYEAGLVNKETDVSQLAQSLKPQLISLVHDPTTSPAIRDLAEAIVARFNGPALLSGDTGLNYQLIMQVPLSFFDKRIDATLQWNGRMKENNQIDAEYARVLFYLDLEALHHTVIDMQVQNRIVTVTIFNEAPGLKALGELFVNRLSEGLENADYRLSGVFFKQFMEEMKKKPVEQNRENGIDFKI